MLPRRLPKLASEMPDLFSTPDARQVLHSYVWPITSSTADRARVETALAAVPRAQLPALAKFTMVHFQWARDAIAQRMERILYPGLLVRELQEAAYAPATPQASPQTTPRKNKQRSPVTQITDFFASASAHSPERARNRSRIVQVHAERAAAYGTDVRVSYDTQPYLGQIQRALELEESDGSVVRAWLPECLLLAQGPQEQALLRAYRQQQQRKALGSPSKKQKSADQPMLTAFFQGTKGAREGAGKSADRAPVPFRVPERVPAERVSHAPAPASTASVPTPTKERDVFGGPVRGAQKAPAAIAKGAAPVVAARRAAPLATPLGPAAAKVPVPATPVASVPAAPAPAAPAAPTPSIAHAPSPDTSIEFLGMRAAPDADVSCETSLSSIESPHALLERVCQRTSVQ